MIRAEYLRFLQSLNSDAVPENLRKIANLVLDNLNVLVPLGTHQGQRVKRMVALAQANMESVGADIQPLPEQNEVQVLPINQLKSLTVGPFRGFAKQEVFDLANRLVLIYGPNGTGKSSFCEALEHGLLGNVTDAESKRFRDQLEYLKNAHTNRFLAPEVMGVNDQSEDVPIVANEALYRFCFVEKNRIESFSRIAAQAPAKQIELISTLFGLDSFNEFVRSFTAEIDDRYIDLVGVKARELTHKRQALAGSQQQVITNTEELQKLDKEELALALQYRDGSTFSQIVAELHGGGQRPGVIQQLETELQQPIANKSNLTIATLQALRQSINTNLTELTYKRQELVAASQQVSFKQLYEAVAQVQPSSPGHCPACKTPLNQVVENPYAHASKELQKLQHLAELQQTVQGHDQSINQSLLELSHIVSTCCNYFSSNPLHNYKLPPNSQGTIEWWNTLHQPLQDSSTPWQHLESQVKQREDTDKTIDQAAQLRVAKQAELNRLREYARQITVLQTRRQSAQQAISSAQKAIFNFDTKNAQLILNVETEKPLVAKNHIIASSYAAFVRRLNAYKGSLPGQLVADLGEIVVSLYNAFNRNDSQSELLATVRLPLAQNQRLKISFQNGPKLFFDALHVLSEGHIRCIGLAILLAKNLKENCPILIFDDPVNAIDDDHRESIRRTLFEDQYFAGKQIILTCHGEEFFKDIQNLLPVQSAAQSRSFSFLPRLDEPHIRIDFNCAPRNYIISARGHFDRNEIRESLSKSRQALESLTKGKVWRYVNSHGDGNLSLKLRSPTASIELRNLTEQLKKQISKGDFRGQNKNTVLEPINILLGFNGDSREWRYLNKGTHEDVDRAEFDMQTVKAIVTSLEQLDMALV